MRDGLYKVEFKTLLGAGSGVVVLQDGRLRGGDAALYYVGTYGIEGNAFLANVVTNRHTNYPGIVSVFGIDRVHINLKGTFEEDTITALGTAAEAPNIKFQARLQRISD
jgi:hypothetical protein